MHDRLHHYLSLLIGPAVVEGLPYSSVNILEFPCRATFTEMKISCMNLVQIEMTFGSL